MNKVNPDVDIYVNGEHYINSKKVEKEIMNVVKLTIEEMKKSIDICFDVYVEGLNDGV